MTRGCVGEAGWLGPPSPLREVAPNGLERVVKRRTYRAADAVMIRSLMSNNCEDWVVSKFNELINPGGEAGGVRTGIAPRHPFGTAGGV